MSRTKKKIVDLQNATAVTIKQLRKAFQIQKRSRAADCQPERGGSRATEIIRQHFGFTK